MAKGGHQGGGTQDDDAKHVLDEFGQQVYNEKVKSESNGFKDDLKGSLTSSRFFVGELGSTDDPCKLVEDYYNNRLNADARGKRYPCANRQTVRFSDEYGGQCTYNRIKDNETRDNECGACAPFRRLHLCDYNLEKMGRTSTTKHDLLAEVCMAAKYEGDSIKTHYTPYQQIYGDTGSTICTVLARSFADIGDIIRGKDLYLGDKGEKKKLEKNLKRIFGDIYEELSRTSTSGRTNGKKEEIEARYKDEADKNYYKLREDWWNANRETVWKAITCGHPGGTYFRRTCFNGRSETNNNCRCDDKPNTDPPTYFDYVPQYLRWFEEWAEDFCRKRKHKLQNAIEQCRGKNDMGEPKYCSGNGYDCKKTVREKRELVEGDDCHKCSVSCKPFVKWIDNQKKEFDKQKKKYNEEIKKPHPTTITIKTANEYTTINNWYVKEFYDKLKSVYKDVDAFLGLLNKEGICQSEPQAGDKKASKVDFTKDETNGTFCRTEICEPCPWCGTEKKGEKWEAIDETKCRKGEIKTFDDTNSTPINLLVKVESGTNIVEKLGGLCNDPSKPTIQEWKCRFESSQKNYCVLQKDKKNTTPQEIESFNSLFWHWITEMFEDFIKWRKEHSECINKKEETKCIRNCKKPCDCFKNWVDQKKKEWEQVLKVYDEQPDFIGVFTPYGTFEYLLKEDYFPKIKAPYKEVKSVQEMQRINNENLKDISSVTKDDNSINTFLEHEEKEAKDCQSKHNEDQCKKQKQQRQKQAAREPAGRSLPGEENATSPAVPVNDDSDEEEEEEKENVHDGGQDTADETAKEVPSPPAATTQDNAEKPCEIVDKLFKDGTSLQEACPTKYGPGGKENFPNWKCVTPSGKPDATTDGESATTGKTTTSGATTGGLCIPPRRRKLYIGKIKEWATNTVTPQAGETTPQGDTPSPSETPSQPNSSSTTPPSDPRDGLLKAFVESAAVETFFLWHRYKKEWEAQKAAELQRNGDLPFFTSGSPPGLLPKVVTDNSNPQNTLLRGDIPPPFLRQMFYTLGDYRDILVRGGDVNSGSKKEGGGSNSDRNIVLNAGGDQKSTDEMKKIQKAIDEHINSLNKASSVSQQQPSGQPITRESWWNQNAKHIWDGMICALTYDTDSGAKGKPPTQNEKVKKELLDTDGTKPKEDGKYNYKTVVLKDENSDTQAKTNDTIQPPTLKQFTSRPPYFRYLEEWGEEFCRKQKHKLEIIRVECRGKEDGDKNCSRYGENCDDQLKDDPSTDADLKCPRCGRHCSSYTKWIKIKKDEYEKQKNAYTGQKKQNCKEGSDKAESDNGFCGTPETTCNTAKEFLQKLGSCKKDNNENESGQGSGGHNKNIFEDTDQTFKPAKNCKPCSQFKVKCERNGHCDNTEGSNCKSKDSIGPTDIGNGGNSIGNIDMVVSDKDANGFNGLDACGSANIFKGIRKEQWKCGKVCGYEVCKPENGNGENVSGENNDQIITIRGLVEHWVHNFLEDYNRIRKKLKACMKNGKGSICKKDCQNKYKCAVQWISKKKQEWQQIRKRYLEQYKNGYGENYNVKTILEKLQPQTDVNKAIKPCGSLDLFQESRHCAIDANSQNGQKRDVVVCLIEKLEKEAEKYKDNHETSGENKNQECVDSSTPVEDDDDPLEEVDQNPEDAQKMIPKICDGLITQQQPTEEETCDPVTPTGNNKEKNIEVKEEEGSGSGDQDSGVPPSIPAAPAPAPPKEPTATSSEETPKEKPEAGPPPSPPPPSLPPADQPFDPTILQTTIPFGVALALGSIAFLFLKVKVNIYVWGICLRVGVFGYIYKYIYVYVYVCILYIFHIYLCIYIDKEKIEKKKYISSNKKK